MTRTNRIFGKPSRKHSKVQKSVQNEFSEKSQIVCIKHHGNLEPNEIAQRLEKENIIISPRNDRIRIAPHFFNNREDIERLIEVLP